MDARKTFPGFGSDLEPTASQACALTARAHPAVLKVFEPGAPVTLPCGDVVVPACDALVHVPGLAGTAMASVLTGREQLGRRSLKEVAAAFAAEGRVLFCLGSGGLDDARLRSAAAVVRHRDGAEIDPEMVRQVREAAPGKRRFTPAECLRRGQQLSDVAPAVHHLVAIGELARDPSADLRLDTPLIRRGPGAVRAWAPAEQPANGTASLPSAAGD